MLIYRIMRKTIKTLTQDYKIGPEITGEIVTIGGYKFCIHWPNSGYISATEVSTGTLAASVGKIGHKAPKRLLLDKLKNAVESGEMQAALVMVRTKIEAYKMALEKSIRETPDLPINEL